MLANLHVRSYRLRRRHGAALTGIPVTKGSQDALNFVITEATTNTHYNQRSAVRLGHWPLVLMACRAFRYPVPPQVWRDLLPNLRPPTETSREGGTNE